VKTRISTYHTQTKPLVGYYKKRASSGDPGAPRYVRIDGSGPVERIRDELFSAVGRK